MSQTRKHPFKRRFAVVAMWPEQPVAEHENIARMKTAAEALDLELLVVDKHGYTIGPLRRQITSDDVDFVIHLHYETPKSFDAFSYAALWNPLQFYFDWGFDRYVANQLSHDGYLSTGGASVADLFCALARPVSKLWPQDLPLLNHTLPGPVIAAKLMSPRKACYCGINWEKVDGRPGRHTEILRQLDDKGLIDIYGPERVKGIEVWSDYAGYKGSLPFDGSSIVKACARAGITLVLSSEPHKESGIMSNRLFEALAAGSLIIGDDHPFLRRALGTHYLPINTRLSKTAQAEEVVEHVQWANTHPQEALLKAKSAQDLFSSNFDLVHQLRKLYEHHESVVSRRNKDRAAAHIFTFDLVLIPHGDLQAGTFSRWLDALKRQTFPATVIHIVLTSDEDAQRFRFAANELRLPSSVKWHTPATLECSDDAPHGMLLAQISKHHAKSQYILCSNGFDAPHHTWLESFANLASSNRSASTLRCNALIEHYDAGHNVHYDLWTPGSLLPASHIPSHLAVKVDFINQHAALLSYMDDQRFHHALEMLSVDSAASTSLPLLTFPLKDFERANTRRSTKSLSRSAHDQERLISAYLETNGSTAQKHALRLFRLESNVKPAHSYATAESIDKWRQVFSSGLGTVRLLALCNPIASRVIYSLCLSKATKRAIRSFAEEYWTLHPDLASSKAFGRTSWQGPLGAVNHAFRHGLAENRASLADLVGRTSL